MFSTPKQRQAIGIMVKQLGYSKDVKESLVQSFSNNRVYSTSDMFFDEAGDLVNHLKEKLGLDDSPKEKMQRKIISLAHEMGWKLPRSKKIDIPRLDDWCIKSGLYHKPFRDHIEAELPALVTQFEQVHIYYLKGV